MYDEYDGIARFLSWTSNQTTDRWYFPKSREIYQGFTQRYKFNDTKIAKKKKIKKNKKKKKNKNK